LKNLQETQNQKLHTLTFKFTQWTSIEHSEGLAMSVLKLKRQIQNSTVAYNVEQIGTESKRILQQQKH
jgi:hypothetical protein